MLSAVGGGAVAGPDDRCASVGDVDESRRGDDGGGCGVLGPNGGDSDVCYALLRMRPLSISWAEDFVVISMRKSRL
jgi:hypothetical protein